MTKNYHEIDLGYHEIDLSTVPDCCLSCNYGDWDGEGCDVLVNEGYGNHEGGKTVETGFVDMFFHVCDGFKREKWANKS